MKTIGNLRRFAHRGLEKVTGNRGRAPDARDRGQPIPVHDQAQRKKMNPRMEQSSATC